jgi:hypothetical protein
MGMKFLISLLSLIFSLSLFAIPCDCEIRVYAPLTGSYRKPVTIIKNFELEDYSFYNQKNITSCRNSCFETFQSKMGPERLKSLLQNESRQLIIQGLLGFNCTGLTTINYPVRVRAKLGSMGLGNVEDFIQVINHEEICL